MNVILVFIIFDVRKSMKKENEDAIMRENLINEINQVENILLNAYKNMQLVEEDGLLDYYAYKIKSEEAKHEYLMKKIKSIEINPTS